MPFKKGDPKPPTSGRKKGTPNLINLDVAKRLEELGCDPFEGMSIIANDPKCSKELRGKMLAELAQYVAPKRRSVEGPNGGPVSISIAQVLAERMKTDV